jgi:hypothetical protein
MRILLEEIIDLKSLEREVEKMPELLRLVVIVLAERLNASVEGFTKVAGQVAEAVRAIELQALPSAKAEGQ